MDAKPVETSAPAAPDDTKVAAARRPRRGLRFWLWIAAAVVVLAPLLFYVGTVCYIRLGLMNGSISAQIADLFGIHTQVGSVTTHWLENLQIRDIEVDAAAPGKPLKVDAVHLDWDLGPLLASGRVRSVRIEHPTLDLKRAANGEWNFSLKTPKNTEASGEIEQIVINHGDLTLGSDTAQLTHIKDLNATYANTGRLVPRTFTLRGTLDSAEQFSASGAFGPGMNLVANLDGGTVLETDWPSLHSHGGTAGRLHYELGLRRGPAAENEKTPGPLNVSGHIDIATLRQTLAPGHELEITDKRVHVQSAIQFDSDDAGTTLFHDAKLSFDGVGSLSAAKLACGGRDGAWSVQNGALQLDVAALNALFKPPFLDEHVTVEGVLRATGVDFSSAQKDGAFHLAGDVATAGARFALPGIGELPPCSAQGHLDWPALTQVKLAFGSVFNAALELRDLRPDPWGQNEAAWAGILAQSTVSELNLDVGQFMQSDAGRRLLYGTSKRNRAIPPELPVAFEGVLSAKNIQPQLAHGLDGRSGVIIPGLQVRDLTLTRWPFSLRVPTLVLSGNVTATLGCDRDFGPVALSCTVAEVLPKPLTGPGISGEFDIAFGPDAHGVWQPRPLRIKTLAIPFAALNRVVSLAEVLGITVDGKATVSDTIFDTNSGDFKGHVLIDAPSVGLSVPEQLQPLLVNALRSAHYTLSASVLENYPITTARFTNFSADIDVTRAGSTDVVSGKTHRGTLTVKLPVVGSEVGLFSLPELQFRYEHSRPQEGQNRYALAIDWPKDNALAVKLADDGGGVLKLEGEFSSHVTNGKKVAFAAAADLQKRIVGPVTLTMSSIDAAELNAIAAAVGPRMESNPLPVYGEFQNAKFELPAFPLRGLAAPKSINAKITGKFSGFGIKLNDWDRVELSGPVVCILNYAAGTLGVNTLVTLENYGALLGGTFLIPPPPAGRAGSLKLAGKFAASGANGSEFLIENLDLNLAGNILATAEGSILSTGTEPISDIKLQHFRVSSADLQDAARTILPANLDPRSWYETMDLAGNGAVDGDFTWNESGRSQLNARLHLRHGVFTIGKTAPLIFRELNGDVPFVLRNGSGAGDAGAPLEQRGVLTVEAINAAPLTIAQRKFEFIATPNSVKFVPPLRVETPDGPVSVDEASLANLKRLVGDARRVRFDDEPNAPLDNKPPTPAPTPEHRAELNLDQQTPALDAIRARIAARSEQLQRAKESGAIGEGLHGLLEIRVPATQPLPELRALRAAFLEENRDRAALFEKLISASGLADADLARVAAAFAKKQRDAASPADWVRNPKDGVWIQKKNLD